MTLLGAHMSIKGGLFKSLIRGKKAGCHVIQIFTRNTSRWSSRPLSQNEIDAFTETVKETSIIPVAAHDSYLINLASANVDVRKKSFHALLDEMDRTERLDIPYLVIHPGSHLGDGEKLGLKRISDALNKVYEKAPNQDQGVEILLETTAGQGTNLGYRFEHLAEILERTDNNKRLGVCLDTCHVFAAGYDFRTGESYRELIKNFDKIIGLNRLKLFHLNDSKKELGSKIDRHEHLGHGYIGREGLSFFLRDPRFRDLPFVLETPKGQDENGVDWDAVNLNFCNSLAP